MSLSSPWSRLVIPFNCKQHHDELCRKLINAQVLQEWNLQHSSEDQRDKVTIGYTSAFESSDDESGDDAPAVTARESVTANVEALDTSNTSTTNDHFSAMPEGPTTGFVGLEQAANEVILVQNFNDKGTRLVTGSAAECIQVLDIDEDEELHLTDVWRAHQGEVIDVKWNGSAMGQVIGSIGDDLELKIWEENPSQPKRSGRRFTCAYRQSSGNGVVYSSLDFTNIRHETYLALVTRDGLLSLMEPVDAEKFDDWKELDQILVCGEFVGRNVETQFRVAFQKTPRPNHGAIQAGVDKKALTLAVTALDKVYIYRIQKTGHSGDGQYKIQAPVAELTGSDGLVRDVAWSSSFYLPYDWIATAAADSYVRIYELTTPADNQSRSQDILISGEPASRASMRPASGIGAGLAGPAITPSFFSVRHEWKLLAKLKHEGVWRVVWMPNVHALVSTGDDEVTRTWMKNAETEEWLEQE